MTKQERSVQKVRALIDTSTIHYNPTGPGDYNLPSSFGELPPPRVKDKAASRADHVLVTKPSFSIGVPIDEARMYTSNGQACYTFKGPNSPPIGIYDPVDPRYSNFEDKAKLNLIRAQR